MTQIAPHLALLKGLTNAELHVLDPYGQSLTTLELNPSQCQALANALLEFTPIAPLLDLLVSSDEDPSGRNVRSSEAVEVARTERPFLPNPSTDWAGMTKAAIVAEVQARYGVDLDFTDLKDDLIAQAVGLEQAPQDFPLR